MPPILAVDNHQGCREIGMHRAWLIACQCAGGQPEMRAYSRPSWLWRITWTVERTHVASRCCPTTRPGGLSWCSRCSSHACWPRLMQPSTCR